MQQIRIRKGYHDRNVVSVVILILVSLASPYQLPWIHLSARTDSPNVLVAWRQVHQITIECDVGIQTHRSWRSSSQSQLLSLLSAVPTSAARHILLALSSNPSFAACRHVNYVAWIREIKLPSYHECRDPKNNITTSLTGYIITNTKYVNNDKP